MSALSSRAYSTFSGADIKAVFGGKEIGTLMAISYAIQREKAPVFVLGEANAIGFSRGKRGIAGSLIFIQLADHPILGADGGIADKQFAKKTYEKSPTLIGDREDEGLGLSTSMSALATPFYADQILPFDITISAANELGQVARCVIHHVELMNEGWGMGIEDKQSDMQSTYMARAVTRWKKGDESKKVTVEGNQLSLE